MSDPYWYEKEIEELRTEIERLRAAYDDAVSRQQARRDATIEECAREIEAKTDGAAYPLTVELARQMAAAIRALKDKP